MSLKSKVLTSIAISIILLGSGYFAGVRSTYVESSAKVQEAESKAKVAQGKAEAFAEEARKANERVQAGKKEEARLSENSAALQRKCDELRAAYNHAVGNQSSGAMDPLPPPNPGDDSACLQLLAIANSQGALIESQKKEIANDKAIIKGLEDESGHWQKAYEQENLRANLLDIALQAQKAAAKGERWKGRLEGFVAGSMAIEAYRLTK